LGYYVGWLAQNYFFSFIPMDLIVSVLIMSVAVGITSYLLPGVVVASFPTAIVVAVVLGLVNTFLRPLLVVLAFPINILTVGLFTFVINALLILLVARLVPGFKVDSFWWALLFSMILSFVNGALFTIFK
jgi:putative membrane protein